MTQFPLGAESSFSSGFFRDLPRLSSNVLVFVLAGETFGRSFNCVLSIVATRVNNSLVMSLPAGSAWS